MPRRKHLFSFKKFDILQKNSPFKVGTDGVLLGAWAGVDHPESILDIGTGTGLVALMLAQRFPYTIVTGIEMQEAASLDALHNVRNSPFSERVKIVTYDFLRWSTQQRFDLIVSNPPYFIKSLPSEHQGKRLARHQDSLPLQDLIPKAVQILTERGRITLILPTEVMEIAEIIALDNGLYPIRKCRVYSFEGENPVRILQDWSLQLISPEVTELIINKSKNQYSETYKEFTKPFYL
jgi:tRNA1Val (adenine37-N6)-methyltransferase